MELRIGTNRRITKIWTKIKIFSDFSPTLVIYLGTKILLLGPKIFLGQQTFYLGTCIWERVVSHNISLQNSYLRLITCNNSVLLLVKKRCLPLILFSKWKWKNRTERHNQTTKTHYHHSYYCFSKVSLFFLNLRKITTFLKVKKI